MKTKIVEQSWGSGVFSDMKPLLIIIAVLFFQQEAFAQKLVDVRFSNDYKDVFHLSLIIYTPDGKGQTRVSDLTPGQTKAYTFPAGTEIFVADSKQEAFAMKGNYIKTTGLKPTFVIGDSSKQVSIMLSTLTRTESGSAPK